MLLLSSVGTSLLLSSCSTEEEKQEIKEAKQKFDESRGYGRTPKEAARDARLMEEIFFNAHEMATITILSDIIMPADDKYGSATDAGVPDFIEFIVKDLPSHKVPMRGGLRWLDYECCQLFGKSFIDCTPEQQIQIIDEIAYPGLVKPEYEQGEEFFNRMRNLVTTGYFTSKIGIECLGYVGNRPNVWDGVPDDVLKKHGLEYPKEMLGKYMDPATRAIPMDWEAYKKEHNIG